MKDSSGDNWVGKSRENNLGNRIFNVIISRFGLNPAYFVLFFAATQYTLLDKKSRKVIKEFRSRLGLKTTILDYYRHFYSFGISLIDRYAYLLSEKSLFSYTFLREDVIAEYVSRGKGVILLGAHMGNWEVAGNLLKERLNVRVNLLMYDIESEETKKTFSRALNNRDVNIINITLDSPDSMIEIVNALRRGEIICMHGDRIMGNQRGRRIEFLGREALFPSGPFDIAAVTGAALIPFYALKTSWKHYTFRAFDPVVIRYSDREERQKLISAAMDAYVKTLESVAKEFPCQWYNFYDFWPDTISEGQLQVGQDWLAS